MKTPKLFGHALQSAKPTLKSVLVLQIGQEPEPSASFVTCAQVLGISS